MELMTILFFASLKFLRLFWCPVLALIFPKKSGHIPPIKNALLELSVVDLAQKIRQKEVSSEEVIKAYIERIREVNPILNAVNDDRFNDALQDARAADRLVRELSQEELCEKYPLLGVPFSTKESIGVKGLAFAVGSLFRAHEKAPQDARVVHLLRESGAIPICVTNIPEWCLAYETYNHLNGRTLNPYDLNRTSGGSSGGEAALISSGGSVFGLGSDVGGSIRIPALFCGIFGHKTTPGLITLEGLFPTSNDKNLLKFLALGPITRYGKDLKLILHVITGRDPRLRLYEPITAKINIFYKYEFNGVGFEAVRMDKSLTKSMQKALDYFRSKGSSVAETQIDFSDIYNIGVAVLMSIEDVPDLLSYGKETRSVCAWEMIKSCFGKSMYTFQALALTGMRDSKPFVSRSMITKYTAVFENMEQEFLRILGDNGVMFFPTYTLPAFRHYEAPTLFSAVAYSQLFNILGFPATHVPMGLNEDGLPVGFEVIAAPFQDRLCLAIASELEAAFGGWTPPS